MNGSPSTNKKAFGGCLTAFVSVFLLIVALLTFNALTPYLRDRRSVTVTLTDDRNQPVANATLHVHEFERIFFIPPLAFASPSHLIDRRITVKTDSNGKAQFAVKLQNATANRISVDGQQLRVLSYQTNNSFRGPGRIITVPVRNDYSLDWAAMGGVSKVSYETIVVVSTAQPE